MADKVSQSPDVSETADKFADQLWARTFDAFPIIGMGLGSRLGLFDLMATYDEPKTSEDIAKAAGYKERYVREWLGLMVTGHILKIDESGEKFYLPVEHRQTMTGCDGPAVFSQAVLLCGQSQEELEQCFKLDGPTGIPYSSYPRMHEYFDQLAVEENKWERIKSRFILVPGLLDKLETGMEICELGSSMGRAVFQVAERFPKTKICGLDLSEDCIKKAQAEAKKKNLENVQFKVQDICCMPPDWSGKWDLVWMYDVAHDVPYTTKMLKEVFRIVKPGGYFIMSEMDVHSEPKDNLDVAMARMVYGFSLFHCMPVSLNEKDGEGLGAAWGMEKPRKVLKDTGFDIVNQVDATFVCKKPN